MQTGVVEATYPVLGGFKWSRHLPRDDATPLDGRATSSLGTSLWIAIRLTLIVGAIFLAGRWSCSARPRRRWGVLGVPAAVLTGLAFATPIAAFAATQRDATRVRRPLAVRRSCRCSCSRGTFFPIDQLPALLQPVA